MQPALLFPIAAQNLEPLAPLLLHTLPAQLCLNLRMLCLTLCMLRCSKCPADSAYATGVEMRPIGQVAVRANPFLDKVPNSCSTQSYQVCLSP